MPLLHAYLIHCRVESAHSTFKEFMTPKGAMSLDTVFDSMHAALQVQISEIKASFGESRFKGMTSAATEDVVTATFCFS